MLICATAAILTAYTAMQPESPVSSKGGQRGSNAPAASATSLAALRTAAERSDFRATAKYDEVNSYLRDLAAASALVRLSDIGKSGEGRTIPLALLADPPVSTPEEAKKSGKLIIAMLGGIHSGECDGKEALLALARDVAGARKAKVDGKEDALSPLLDSCILVFIPIYNPDGNEKMDPKNRPGQIGPDAMGKRENGAGLDLNRDFVKLEAPETRALLRFINQYDPAILIDTHTTNGSYHRYALTYDTNKNPAGDGKLLDFARKTMLPEIGAAVKEHAKIDTFWYGNFEHDHEHWETYPDEPRYGINYVGMRNRIGILTESYSYATYKQRIDAQYAFVTECLAYAAAHKADIRRLEAEADGRASSGPGSEVSAGGRQGRGGFGRQGRGRPPGGQPPANADRAEEPRPARQPSEAPQIVVRSKAAPREGKTSVLGWVEETKDGHTHPTTQPKDYEAEIIVDFVPEETVARPYAYILPSSSLAAVQTLQRHGIRVEETREDIELDTTASTVDAVTKAVRPFQNHSMVSVKASSHAASRRFPAGSYLVRTAQPLGNLASYLLEPTAADGLTAWNSFDDGLKIGEDFPVARIEKPMPITAIAAAELPEDAKPKQPITYDLVYESDHPPNLMGSPVGGLTWVDDTSFLQNKDGKLYKVEAATGRAEPYIDPAPIAAALAKLPGLTKRDADSIANRPGFSWNKDRTAFVFEHANDLYYCTMDGSSACRLTSTPEPEESWTLSPDGRLVAFVRKNDLWVVDVATHTERALTTSGSDTIRNGKSDWVYWEEIFNRNSRPYWWSPDSSRIAFFQIDSSPIKTYTIVNDVPEGQNVERTQYPKVGGPNPTVKFFTVQASGGTPSEVDLSQYTSQDLWLANGGWFPDSSQVYLYAMNRVQTWADMLSAPADGGTPTVLFRETTKAWVEPPDPVTFLKDGTFLFRSERSGWKHFYHYARDGKLLGPVTDGEWEARSIVELDDEHGFLYISGTKDSPIAENLYRVKLGGGDVQRLTAAPGAHHTDVSPGGTHFVDSWSSHDTPTRVVLRKTEDQTVVRTLDTNPVRDLDRYILAPFELVHIPTPDGFVMEGSILKPADFDPKKQYPVWFTTYGGPQAPTVFDSWGARTWDNALAHDGFIIFRADPRSASGKGAVSAWTSYKQLGVGELADIETAIKWLCKNEWVDASRIGMSGHSYGGFMTSYALTHSTLFAAGIAGAPVTDWRDYDSCYTERFMLTPAENPDGYDKTSVVKGAAKLHGRLLLLHGLIDDNVHLQNSERLIRALQRANKQFELMLYPESRHGIGGKHYNTLMHDFIVRTLGSPLPRPETPSSEPVVPARTGP